MLGKQSKEQSHEFLGMLLGTLSASLLRNLSTGETEIRAGELQLEQMKT